MFVLATQTTFQVLTYYSAKKWSSGPIYFGATHLWRQFFEKGFDIKDIPNQAKKLQATMITTEYSLVECDHPCSNQAGDGHTMKSRISNF